MEYKTITIEELKTRAEQCLNEATEEPIYITRDGQSVRILADVEEYERFRAFDTRRAYDLRTDELPWVKEAIEKGDQELDWLMAEWDNV